MAWRLCSTFMFPFPKSSFLASTMVWFMCLIKLVTLVVNKLATLSFLFQQRNVTPIPGTELRVWGSDHGDHRWSSMLNMDDFYPRERSWIMVKHWWRVLPMTGMVVINISMTFVILYERFLLMLFSYGTAKSSGWDIPAHILGDVWRLKAYPSTLLVSEYNDS